MSFALLAVQTLNGLQLGVLLFLIAAGLTLTFGVMDFVNLAHGVQYMVGAYLAAMFASWTGGFWARSPSRCRPRSPSAWPSNFGLSLALRPRPSLPISRDLWRHSVSESRGEDDLGSGAAERAHARCAVGEHPADAGPAVPGLSAGADRGGPCDGVGSLSVINQTRVGMLVRAGATNAPMVSALGVDIRRLFMLVFGFGSMLAGFAGALVAPILSVSRAWATIS